MENKGFKKKYINRKPLGGDEDSWICQKGEWIKHGNPSQPQPLKPCNE